MAVHIDRLYAFAADHGLAPRTACGRSALRGVIAMRIVNVTLALEAAAVEQDFRQTGIDFSGHLLSLDCRFFWIFCDERNRRGGCSARRALHYRTAHGSGALCLPVALPKDVEAITLRKKSAATNGRRDSASAGKFKQW
jgi:hypothetical protein